MRMFVCVTGACTFFLGFSYCRWWRMDRDAWAARQVSPPHAQVTVRPRRAPQALGPREPPSSCPARSPVLVPAASRRPATPQHRTLLARMPPRAHDGTDGGDPAPGVPTSLRARCTCPGLQGFWLRSVRDLGAAAHGEAESTNRSAASHLVSVATRSLQPPSCPLSERQPSSCKRTSQAPLLAQQSPGRRSP